MPTSEQKIIQYLREAEATEQALVRVLQEQIAMTPRGTYRTALDQHLRETRDHAARVGKRLRALGEGRATLGGALGVVQSVAAQMLAVSKAPLDLLRGSGGEEKVLKNAKDTAATEALEIATYTAIERLAEAVGDKETARLAATIRGDEEKMLARVMREIPKLTDAVVSAKVEGKPSYDVSKTGAAEAARGAGRTAKRAARRTSSQAKRTGRQARKVPGVAQVEGQAKGLVASERDLAIPNYDSLAADEVTRRLPELSQIDLAKIDSYERRHENRSTVLSRISTLRADEPWPGYDEQTVSEIEQALSSGDGDRATRVREYERSHKNRAGVLTAATRERSPA